MGLRIHLDYVRCFPGALLPVGVVYCWHRKQIHVTSSCYRGLTAGPYKSGLVALFLDLPRGVALTIGHLLMAGDFSSTSADPSKLSEIESLASVGVSFHWQIEEREMQAPFRVMSSNSMAAVTMASCPITRFFVDFRPFCNMTGRDSLSKTILPFTR